MNGHRISGATEVASLFTKDVYLDKSTLKSVIQTLNGLVDQAMIVTYPLKVLDLAVRGESGSDCWDMLLLAFKCPSVMTNEILASGSGTLQRYGDESSMEFGKGFASLLFHRCF